MLHQNLRCGTWDLVPRPGIEPGSPALGAQCLTHWTTREILTLNSSNLYDSAK